MTRQIVLRTGTALLLAAAMSSGAGTARAASLASPYTAPLDGSFGGIACADGAPPQMPAVWLGHFQGGTSAYDTTVGQTALAWADVKMCFPSQRSCGAWLRSLRRDLHRPIGYFTCLPLR